MQGQEPHWCGSNTESVTHDNLSGLEKMKESFSLIGFFVLFYCFILCDGKNDTQAVCTLKRRIAFIY